MKPITFNEKTKTLNHTERTAIEWYVCPYCKYFDTKSLGMGGMSKICKVTKNSIGTKRLKAGCGDFHASGYPVYADETKAWLIQRNPNAIGVPMQYHERISCEFTTGASKYNERN